MKSGVRLSRRCCGSVPVDFAAGEWCVQEITNLHARRGRLCRRERRDVNPFGDLGQLFARECANV